MAEKEVISIDLSSDSEPEPEPEKQKPLPSALENSQAKESVLSEEKTRKKRMCKTIEKLSELSCQEFLGRFDPENSNREKRKLSRKFTNDNNTRTGHDDYGMILGTDMDLCDCLEEKCVGCFFPCRSCRSCKCGVDCRNDRRWIIDSIENEADHTITKNPWLLKNRSE